MFDLQQLCMLIFHDLILKIQQIHIKFKSAVKCIFKKMTS